MAFGILTTVVAGLMPSVKASKLDPVIILRG
jgi:ABC-type antimicrobial peptide transport system permease subunit